MTDFRTFLNGTIIMMVGIGLSIIFMIAYAMPSEMVISEFVDAGMYNVGPNWNSYSDVSTMQNLMYLVCISPAVAGIIIFILTSVRTKKEDVEFQDYSIPESDFGV